MIVPAVAPGAASALDRLRTACDEAVARLLAASPDTVCVVGAAETTAEHRFPYRASFAEWGVPVEAPLSEPGPDTPVLPLSVGVGVWLLSRAGGASCRVVTVAAAPPPAEGVQLGDRLAHPGRLVLLALCHGTACPATEGPCYLDPRAEPFDPP